MHIAYFCIPKFNIKLQFNINVFEAVKSCFLFFSYEVQESFKEKR